MHFRLRDGLSYCHVGEQIVFLDVHEDRYFGLSSTAAALFKDAVTGVADAQDLAGTPLARLVEKCDLPGSIRPTDVIVPSESIWSGCQRKLSASNAVGIALAHVEALYGLRLQSLNKVLTRTARRPISRDSNVDVSAAVVAFRRSDAYIGRQDRCLLKTVALANYLRRRGVPARLVMGVALRPFHAHCWVQTDDRLLSDEHDVVSKFVPILAVP